MPTSFPKWRLSKNSSRRPAEDLDYRLTDTRVSLNSFYVFHPRISQKNHNSMMILASFLLTAVSVLQSGGTSGQLPLKKRIYHQMTSQQAMGSGNSQAQATPDNSNKQGRLFFRDRSLPVSDFTLNGADTDSMTSGLTTVEGSGDSEGFFKGIAAPVTIKDMWRESMQIYERVVIDSATHAQPGPRLEYTRNHDEDPVTFLGRLVVGEFVGSSSCSVVYGATAENLVDKALVVKYTNDCLARLGDSSRSRLDNNPIKEYALLSVLARSNVAPVAYHLSGATVMTRETELSIKVRSRRMDRRINDCARIGTRVRYMVEDRMGPTLSEYMKQMFHMRSGNTDLLKDVMRFGVRMIELVREMHNLGVVHGDIHEENVVFRDQKASLNEYRIASDDIALIDFGMAELFPFRFGDPELTDGPADNLNLIHLSPWQLRGYRTGMRDDIFRIAALLANILSETEFRDMLKAKVAAAKRELEDIGLPLLQLNHRLNVDQKFRIIRDREIGVLLEEKSDHIFDGCLEFWDSIDGRFQFEIETRLERFFGRILAINHPDTYPPYDDLINDIRSIIHIL